MAGGRGAVCWEAMLQVGGWQPSLRRTDLDGGGGEHRERKRDPPPQEPVRLRRFIRTVTWLLRIPSALNQKLRLFQLQMPELQSKLAQPEGGFWLTELKGLGAGFRPSWIRGFKCHHNWVSLSQLCFPVLAGSTSRQASLFWWQRWPRATACILASHLGESGIPR